MICAACGQPTTKTACEACKEDPLLDGRYRLLSILGQGAVGIAYKAVRLSDETVVAVKEMPLNRAETDKASELILREVSLLRQLDHPAIPTHFDDFIAGEGKHRALILVQQFIDGQTLAEELDDSRMSEEGAVAVLQEILPILTYLHGLRPPVIHRDIKPSNVMRCEDGRLMLIDFGAARDAVKDPDLGGSTVAGTFGYMAPEQFQGDATPATDLYALGVLGVALLTREEPRAMLDRATLDAWLVAANVSPVLQRYLNTLTEQQPSNRPRSAETAARKLRGVLKALQRGEGDLVDSGPSNQKDENQNLDMMAASIAPEKSKSMGTWSLAVLLFLVASVAWLLISYRGPADDGQLIHRNEFLMNSNKEVSVQGPILPAVCSEGPCRPISEGMLKNVGLNMTLAEAGAAFPALVGAEEIAGARISPEPTNFSFDSIMDASKSAQAVPGTHFLVPTTLFDAVASCQFHLVVDNRVSAMSCTLAGDPSSAESQRALTQSIKGRLENLYGPADPTEGGRAAPVSTAIIDEEFRWMQDDASLVLTANYIMELSADIEISFVRTVHTELVNELQETVDVAYEAARNEAQQAEARERQELLDRVQDPTVQGDL